MNRGRSPDVYPPGLSSSPPLSWTRHVAQSRSPTLRNVLRTLGQPLGNPTHRPGGRLVKSIKFSAVSGLRRLNSPKLTY